MRGDEERGAATLEGLESGASVVVLQTRILSRATLTVAHVVVVVNPLQATHPLDHLVAVLLIGAQA